MEIKTETKVGFFVFVCVSIAVVFILSIGGNTFKRFYTYHAVFDNVSGLKLKAPVKYGGKDVGVVDNIVFINKSPTEIFRVDFSVERGIRIRQGSKASIATAGFIGDAFLNIKPGNKDTYYKDDDTLLTEKSVGLSEIMEQAQKAVDRINNAITSLLGEESGDKVSKILDNVQAASEDLKALMKKAHNLVDESKPKLAATSENLEDFSGNLKGIVKENRGDIRKTITNLRDVSQALDDRVDPILKKLDVFITDLKQISGDNKADIRALIKDLKATGKNFKEFSEDIKKNPWKLLSKPRSKRKRKR